MDNITKLENKKVSDWLIWYDVREKERIIHNLAERGNIINGANYRLSSNGGIYPSIPSDTTGLKGERVIELFEEDEDSEWISLVKGVEKKLPAKMRLLLKLRRECRYTKSIKGRPGWIPYVQRRYAEEIAKRKGISEEEVWIERPQTFTEWWSRIVDFTARCAAKRGLLKSEEKF